MTIKTIFVTRSPKKELSSRKTKKYGKNENNDKILTKSIYCSLSCDIFFFFETIRILFFWLSLSRNRNETNNMIDRVNGLNHKNRKTLFVLNTKFMEWYRLLCNLKLCRFKCQGCSCACGVHLFWDIDPMAGFDFYCHTKDLDKWFLWICRHQLAKLNHFYPVLRHQWKR